MSSHFNFSHASVRPSAVSEGPDLPRDYGMTRLVLLPRDPYWVHAAWEVAPYTWEEVGQKFGRDALNQGRVVLRFYGTGKDKNIFNVDVQVDVHRWYILMPSGGNSWRAELGVLLKDGRFALLAVSNSVQMPSGEVSDILDEQWGVLRAEWDKLFTLSGGGQLGPGSMDLAQILAQRWEFLKGVSSLSSFSSGVSSPASVSQGKDKKFWLVADTEVIVYGSTDPKAKLSFQGKPVSLNADGTFSFRLPFPEGEQSLPVDAQNQEGDLSKKIEFNIKRKTKE